MALGHTHSTNVAHRRAVGVFSSRGVAESSLHELRDSGFSMDRVSVITRDRIQSNEIAGAEVQDSVRNTQRRGNKADDGAVTGAVTGGALGGLTGLLVGLGTLAIPGVGPILLAGATATTLATTAAGGAIGAVTGGLLGALIGLGIPEDRARVYRDRIERGEFLVIVDGTEEEIAFAERVLHRRGIEEYGVYDVPANQGATSGFTQETTTVPIPANRTPVPHRHAVGFFKNRQDAEYAVADLRHMGFPLRQIDLASCHNDRSGAFTGINLHDQFDAARYRLSSHRVRYYHDQFNQGAYVLILSGTADEIRRVEAMLSRRGIQNGEVYDDTVDSLEQSTTAGPQAGSGNANVQQVSSSPNVVIVDRRSNPQ
jgi:uncharacterized protein YcfJ